MPAYDSRLQKGLLHSFQKVWQESPGTVEGSVGAWLCCQRHLSASGNVAQEEGTRAAKVTGRKAQDAGAVVVDKAQDVGGKALDVAADAAGSAKDYSVQKGKELGGAAADKAGEVRC